MQQLPLAITNRKWNTKLSIIVWVWDDFNELSMHCLFALMSVNCAESNISKNSFHISLGRRCFHASQMPQIISAFLPRSVRRSLSDNKQIADRHPNMNSTIGANCITKRFGRKTQIIAVTALLCTLCDCEVWAQIRFFCCIVFAWGSRRWCFATLSLVVCRQSMKMTRWTPPMRDNNAYLSAKLSSFDTTVAMRWATEKGIWPKQKEWDDCKNESWWLNRVE